MSLPHQGADMPVISCAIFIIMMNGHNLSLYLVTAALMKPNSDYNTMHISEKKKIQEQLRLVLTKLTISRLQPQWASHAHLSRQHDWIAELDSLDRIRDDRKKKLTLDPTHLTLSRLGNPSWLGVGLGLGKTQLRGQVSDFLYPPQP